MGVSKFKNGPKRVKGLLFILVFFLVNLGIARFFLHKSLGESRTGTIDRQFHQEARDVDILALGDSHTATGFDPRPFENAFNFALYGESYIYNYYKLEYILRRYPGIRVFILPLDLHSFSSWRSDEFLHDFYWVKYVDYLELGWYKKEPVKFLGKYIRGKFFPYLGEFATLLGVPGQDERERRAPLPEILRGFVVKTESFNKNRRRRARQRVKLHFQGRVPFDDLQVCYFKKILALCAEAQKTLVLVKYPVSELYYRYALNKVPEKEIDRAVLEMVQPYGNVTLLDYRELFFEEDDRYFDDPDHLNEKGAAALAQRLHCDLAACGLTR